MKNNKSVFQSTFSLHQCEFPYTPIGRVVFDYEGLGIDATRRQVVRNAISHFGRLVYNTFMYNFQDAVAQRHRDGLKTRFIGFEDSMSEIEVWRFGQLVPLALEWGLDRYLEDWEQALDEWLDLYPALQEAA